MTTSSGDHAELRAGAAPLDPRAGHPGGARLAATVSGGDQDRTLSAAADRTDTDAAGSRGPSSDETAVPFPALFADVCHALADVGFQTDPQDTDGAPGLTVEAQSRGVVVSWADPVGAHTPSAADSGHEHVSANGYPGIHRALGIAVVVALTGAGFRMDDPVRDNEVVVTGREPGHQGRGRSENDAAAAEMIREAVVARATVDEATGLITATARLTPGQGRAVLQEVSQHTGIPLLRLAELVVGWAGHGEITADLREELERSLARHQPLTGTAPPEGG
ncbi:ANTAR domain-containing protein [Streptomyces sp. NPDC057445]|uniref:ANTAR domain-containing protein n=1 Tax=Streptomyces sp. NPDC057445 TaxID=3346136 RepID=UPI0036B0DC53